MLFRSIDPKVHDIRFVEDDWESPTLGAWGLGWEVWLDGMEVTQFTYFQEVGSLQCKPVLGEITYGLERLAMYLQGVESVFDLTWTPGVTYRDVYHQNEVEQSRYNFELANTELLFQHFGQLEAEAKRLMEAAQAAREILDQPRVVVVAYKMCQLLSAHIRSIRWGAVIVDDQGRVLAGAGNRTEELNDPTAHAEVVALRDAAAKLGNYRLTGATLVVTVEPCEQTALTAALRDIDAENFHAEPPLVMPVLPGEEHVAPVH